MEMSLLLALLDAPPEGPYSDKTPLGSLQTAPDKPQKNYREEYNKIIQAEKDKKNKEKQKKIQEGLYNALYFIIEYPNLPQNKDLSKAIGKTLARAIRENPDPDIKKLCEMLRPVVTEAIDETEIPQSQTGTHP